MFKFFDWFTSFAHNIWNFVSNLINTITSTLELVAGIVHLPAIVIGFVPGFIATSCIVVGAVAILKLTVGWGNS